MAEVVQRRECRKECAVCSLPIPKGQSVEIMTASKEARREKEIKLYQRQLFDAIARVDAFPVNSHSRSESL